MKNLKNPLFIRLPKQTCSATGLPFCLGKGNFIMQEEKEIWKDIIGYAGSYQISNLGRVKSLRRKTRKRKSAGGYLWRLKK